MTGNAFEETLAGFRRWAETTDRTLSADPGDVAVEVSALFDLMPDYLGIDDPARLNAGLLENLLLEVYPRKVTVLAPEDIAPVIPALRDLTAYLLDTGAVTEVTARAMDRELDTIEPKLPAAVMDPANWGPATAMMHAMHSDGVDVSDKAAVDAWIAAQNASAFASHPGAFDDYAEEDLSSWEEADLAEAFDLPDILPPVRLPDEETLTALAAGAPLLTSLRDLARDVREKPVPAANADPLLAGLAAECDLVELDDGVLVPGDDVDWLDDLSEGLAALEAWDYTFAAILDTTLEVADEADPPADADLDLDLDLTGHGITLAMDLFLNRRPGVPVTRLSDSLKNAATDELPDDEAERQWAAWTSAHGDPAGLLLGQLEKLAAVTVTDGVARLEPLAVFAIAAKLRADDVHVPEIPPVSEMTADDVVMLSVAGTEEDLAEDFGAWAAERTPAGAARELLAFAAGETAAIRTRTLEIVARLGADAEPAWREVLDRPELRCYAKAELLTQLAGPDGEQGDTPAPPDLTLTVEDLAWFFADKIGPVAPYIDRDKKVPFDPSQITLGTTTVTAEALFDAMSRLPHPDASAALTMLGKHCDDKKVAKAARKAAFKAASRQASQPTRQS